MGFADNTTIHAVNLEPLSHSQVMESLNQNLVTNHLLMFEVAHKAQP